MRYKKVLAFSMVSVMALSSYTPTYASNPPAKYITGYTTEWYDDGVYDGKLERVQKSGDFVPAQSKIITAVEDSRTSDTIEYEDGEEFRGTLERYVNLIAKVI